MPQNPDLRFGDSYIISSPRVTVKFVDWLVDIILICGPR